MTSMHADNIDDVLTEFIADLIEPVLVQSAQIFGEIDGFEQWSRLYVHIC